MTFGQLVENAMKARGWNPERLAREVSAAAVASGHPGHTVTSQSVRNWIKGATPEKVRLALLVDVLDLPRDQLNLDVAAVRDYRSGPTAEYPMPGEAKRIAALEQKVAELEATLSALAGAPSHGPGRARRAAPTRSA